MPSDVQFRDLRRLLEHHGWELTRVKGSHHHFRGKGRQPISIPVHKGRVKAIYARQVDQAIEELQRQSGG
ncbi:MAG: type II toxin-antitoxin system HicA family toxin [Phycisphaeraceae bacterium]|nr:type II toxin-antitoxin system HicA family toxin [Phycisphaeraceae bacterium]MBX3366516.1 type II toxin-antitoxin system HicA family toxin [Phycisphaeraceae bacterium]